VEIADDLIDFRLRTLPLLPPLGFSFRPAAGSLPTASKGAANSPRLSALFIDTV
jgi:hypothetical protein